MIRPGPERKPSKAVEAAERVVNPPVVLTPLGEAELAAERARPVEVGRVPLAYQYQDVIVKKVPKSLLVRLEAKRAELGLRSRAETIRVLLSEALGRHG